MDFVDISIVGTILFWFGFTVGILVAVDRPTKAEKEQELKDYGYDQPILFDDEAKRIVKKYLPLVNAEEAGMEGFVFSHKMKVANAKQCALHAVELMENAIAIYGKGNDELRNMDSEWRYFDNLKKAIERYNG